MLTSLPAEFFTFVSIGLLIGLIVLLALQVVTSMRVQRLTYPLYEYAQSKAQAEVDRILNDAREQAHKIVADAEASAAALIEKERADIGAHARDYQSALETLSQSAQHALSEQAEKARAEGAALTQALSREVGAQGEEIKTGMARVVHDIGALSENASTQGKDIQRLLEAEGKQAANDLAHAFDEIAQAGRKRIDAEIDAFSKRAEAEIAAYRDSRKKMVEEHLTDLVVEATKIVLQKSLTPEEHVQLVERALKEARTTGIF
jgi:F0F1-type ATP synthase membrane subunit b/b'